MREEELHARFLVAARAFRRDPSEAALEILLSRFSLCHVARHGSEAGLEDELAKIEAQCRLILVGRP